MVVNSFYFFLMMIVQDEYYTSVLKINERVKKTFNFSG